MTSLMLYPVDTQFHRTGLPFDVDLSGEAETFFPPTGRTIYGALRAHGLAAANLLRQGFDDPVYGTPIAKGSLALLGPVIAAKGEGGWTFCFPMPGDVTLDSEEETAVMLAPVREPEANTDLPAGLCRVGFSGHTRVESLESHWFLAACGTTNLRDYLDGSLAGTYGRDFGVSGEDLIRVEHRVGIKKAANRTAEDGYLYATPHHRMDPRFLYGEPGFWVGVNHVLPSGAVRLGGEARVARVAEGPQETDLPWNEAGLVGAVSNLILATGRFKVTLLTPALLQDEQGRPCPLPSEALLAELFGGGPAPLLRAAVVGRSVYVGGWDIRAKRAKPLHRAVPAGTVYFLEYDGWGQLAEQERQALAAKAMTLFHGNNGLQSGEDRKEGFGTSIVGGWDYVQVG